MKQKTVAFALLGVSHALLNIYQDFYSSPKINYIDSQGISLSQAQNLILEHNFKDPDNDFGSYTIINDNLLDSKDLSELPSTAPPGKQYLCYIPNIRVNVSDEDERDRLYSEDKLKEIKSKGLESVSKSLMHLRDYDLTVPNGKGGLDIKKIPSICIYEKVDYWTYEFCFNGSITQFHELYENGVKRRDRNTPIFTLSKFDKQSLDNVELIPSIENDGALDLAQHITGGDECDLTGVSRSVDIRYTCDNNHPFDSYDPSKSLSKINWIRELRTCHYELVISVPSLCTMEEFKGKSGFTEANNIDCSLIENSDLNIVIPRINVEQFDLFSIGHNFFIGTVSSDKDSYHILITSDPDYEVFSESNLQVLGLTLISALDSKILLSKEESMRGTALEIGLKLYDFRGNYMASIKFKLDELGRFVISSAFHDDGEPELTSNLLSAKPGQDNSLNPNFGPAE